MEPVVRGNLSCTLRSAGRSTKTNWNLPFRLAAGVESGFCSGQGSSSFQQSVQMPGKDRKAESEERKVKVAVEFVVGPVVRLPLQPYTTKLV